MQYGNYHLAEELTKLRTQDLVREAEQRGFMEAHGLDLVSLLRRAIEEWRARRRSVEVMRPAEAAKGKEATSRVAA
jgi:hypothetical protein